MNREIPGVEIEEFQRGELVVCIDPLSEREIKAAVGKMKSNKAAGVDKLVAEIYKVCEDESVTVLKILFDKIWEKEVVPESSKEGVGGSNGSRLR